MVIKLCPGGYEHVSLIQAINNARDLIPQNVRSQLAIIGLILCDDQMLRTMVPVKVTKQAKMITGQWQMGRRAQIN
jgi:hypothetical protein